MQKLTICCNFLGFEIRGKYLATFENISNVFLDNLNISFKGAFDAEVNHLQQLHEVVNYLRLLIYHRLQQSARLILQRQCTVMQMLTICEVGNSDLASFATVHACKVKVQDIVQCDADVNRLWKLFGNFDLPSFATLQGQCTVCHSDHLSCVHKYFHIHQQIS